MPGLRKNLNLEMKLILAALVYAAAVFTFTGLDYISERPPKPVRPPKPFVAPPLPYVDVSEAPRLPVSPLPTLPPLPVLPKR